MKINESDIDKVLLELKEKLLARMNKRSGKPHSNRHETLGKLTEEMYEYTKEVKKQNKPKMRDELYDVAESALYGVLSIKDKK